MSDIRHAPRPEVQHLPTIFRKIEAGEIRIPAFQRRFVWDKSQIIKLLQSVYRGYPIGSILLWRVETETLKVSGDSSIPFPKIPVTYPLTFVLDGMQRLSALYGVFYSEQSDEHGNFNVIYDLDLKNFRHYDEDDLPRVFLPLSALFSPRKLIEIQRNLSTLPNGDEYIDATVNLHATFQEYQVPTVTIARQDTKEIVEIFERINTTGTVLSSFDFMRALTWSSEFDLDSEISTIANKYSDLGYSFSPETLVKAMAVIFGLPPIPDEMLKLRNKVSDELHHVVKQLDKAIDTAIYFLRHELSIYGSDFIPYEGQFLALIKAFCSEKELSPEQIQILRKWFWAVGFSEGLRGKPDNYVARTLSSIGAMVDGNLEALKFRFTPQIDDFHERRFMSSSALSASIAMMFSQSQARSLFTGEYIDPESYLAEFSREKFEPLFSIKEVKDSGVLGSATSARIISNMIVVTDADRPHLRSKSGSEIIRNLYTKFGEGEAIKILQSQLLPDNCLTILNNELSDPVFIVLHNRAIEMYGFAESLSR